MNVPDADIGVSDNRLPRGRQTATPKKPGRPAGSFGAHLRTLRLGQQLEEALADGTPLRYLAKARVSQSWHPDRDVRAVEKKFRRALTAARKAAGAAAAPSRSSSPAVGYAHRAFIAHSARHSELYRLYDGPGAYRRTAPVAYWESLAVLCELRIALEYAMAEASGRAPKDWAAYQKRLVSAHRAHAEHLARGSCTAL